MSYFNERIYVGTTRHSMALLKLFPPADPPAMDPWPVAVPKSVEDLDMRGQIWAWDRDANEWENVFRSPLIIGKNKKEVPRDIGFRGMAVFQGLSDPQPALYVGSMSTVLRGTAAHILRSYDGKEFVPVSEPGLGNPQISTFRSLIVFDGHLYAPPAGQGVNFNSNKASVIMRSADPKKGGWEPACEPGFGDLTNNGIFQMAVFADHLYAGTFNHYSGYQIWRTPANGGAPCRWEKVMERGAYRGPLSQIAMAMSSLNGALYVGSSIQNGGYDRYNLVGPGSGEIIRLYPDNSWDLLIGSPRKTPDGMKYPLSGHGPGFDNIFAGYIWRMVVHDGWLYTSTFDWSVYLQYSHRASPTARRLVREFGVDHMTEIGGGFELWRTKDGVNWIPVTRNGFDNPFNYGGRTLVSTPEGLFVGTANPFTPKIPVRVGSSHIYIPNPDGGAEVWLGSHLDTKGAPQEQARDVLEIRSTAPGTGEDVAVTGATGFIGKPLVKQLLDEGHKVRALVLPGTAGDLAELSGHKQLSILEGELNDEKAVSNSVRGATAVIHLAARLGDGSCSKKELRRINIGGTQTLLRACIAHGKLKRFVFASSVAVYEGQYETEAWPIPESGGLRSNGGTDLEDYGITKIAGENLVRWYSKHNDFTHTILRISFIYGPGHKDTEQIVNKFSHEPWFGQGRSGLLPRQYIHVDDVVRSFVLGVTSEHAANQTFTIAGNESVSFLDIAKFTRRLRGTSTATDLSPDRTRNWRRYAFPYDIRKAKKLLEFSASITMAEGLEGIVRK